MDIKDVALRYLAARARTSAEMKEHLLSRGYIEEDVDRLIDTLKEVKYLDDLQYACDYIHYSVSKGRGRIRISQELQRKGIDSFTAEDAFCMISKEDAEQESIVDAERERALIQAMRVVEGKELDKKMMGKVSRRLIGLGYTAETVYYVLGQIMKKES